MTENNFNITSETNRLIPNYCTILQAVWSIWWRSALCFYLLFSQLAITIVLGSIEGVTLEAHQRIIYTTLNFLVFGDPYAYIKMFIVGYLLLLSGLFLSIWQLNRLTYRQGKEIVAFKISKGTAFICLTAISALFIGMGCFRLYIPSLSPSPYPEIIFLCVPTLLLFSYLMRDGCKGFGIFMRRIDG